MIFQSSSVSDPVYALLYFAGIISFLVFFVVYKKFRERIEADNLPRVLIMDLTKWRVIPGGVFMGYNRTLTIEVAGGSNMKLWGIRTNRYMILPSHGNEEDIILHDHDMPNIIICACKVIGLSSHGEEIHKEWAREVFPGINYQIPTHLAELPPNYMFVSPVGMQNWTKSMLLDQFSGLQNIYLQVHKIITTYDQRMAEMYSFYGDVIVQKVQSTNETIMSSWQHFLDAWDTMMRERTVPSAVMKRLFNIPQSKLAHTSLKLAMEHGGINDAIQFVGNLTQAANGLTNALGLVTTNKDLHMAMVEKVNKLQEDNVGTEDDKVQMIRKLAGELGQIKAQMVKMQQSSPQPIAIP